MRPMGPMAIFLFFPRLGRVLKMKAIYSLNFLKVRSIFFVTTKKAVGKVMHNNNLITGHISWSTRSSVFCNH
jgi:hypothetical protein